MTRAGAHPVTAAAGRRSTERRSLPGRSRCPPDFRDVFSEVLRRHRRFKPPRGFFPDCKPGRVAGLF